MRAKTHFYHLLTTAIFLIPALLQAQNLEESNLQVSKTYVHEIDINNDNIDGDVSNMAVTKQFGDRNAIKIVQKNTGDVSQFSSVSQRGDDNQFYLIQEGFENSISAEQNGYLNSMDIGIYGHSNDFEYTQDGDLNKLKHRTYLNNGSGAIRQSGDNNEINLDERGSNYLNGITVKQTGGMKVNITTSIK